LQTAVFYGQTKPVTPHDIARLRLGRGCDHVKPETVYSMTGKPPALFRAARLRSCRRRGLENSLLRHMNCCQIIR